jgi:ATP-dependent Clp protease adaptor protein ClpS
MPNNPRYNVLLLNDDVTPMEFVVHALQEYLDFGYDEALKVMLRVHHEGKAVCGTFERDEAETRLAAILASAHRHNHPLKCILEEAR